MSKILESVACPVSWLRSSLFTSSFCCLSHCSKSFA